MIERRQSKGEEIANIVGASVFAATMVLLYCASTLYHVAPSAR